MTVRINTRDGKQATMKGNDDNDVQGIVMALSGTGFVNVCNGTVKRWVRREDIVSFTISMGD